MTAARVTRRGALSGAALGMLGFSDPAQAAAAGHAGPLLVPSADPFATYEARIQAIYAELRRLDADDPISDDKLDELLKRKTAIDEAALLGVPRTLAGAVGALELARREYHQFRVEGLEESSAVDMVEHLVLHMLDGALGVLRPLVRDAS